MPEGPLGAPRPFASGIRELQINFRFNRTAQRGSDLEDIVVDSAPDTSSVRESLVYPDVQERVISVTIDNQLVKQDLDNWEQRVENRVAASDIRVQLEEVVIIGEFS